MSYPNLIVVTGPTASGKTRFAAHLAARIQGEIISADSRQVYKGMDLGTGKDFQDYVAEGNRIPYHLIDILEPGEEYDVYHFQQDFYRVFRDICRRGRFPVLCGGTGMYVEAVTEHYRLKEVAPNLHLRRRMEQKSMEELRQWYYRIVENPHNVTDINDRERLMRAIEIATIQEEANAEARPDINPVLFVVYFERELQKKRIRERLLQRLDQGMVDEVKDLLKKGLSHEKLDYYGLEYRYISRYLAGEIAYEQMVEQLNIAIRQFAKRQMTWFRRMERKGHILYWIDGKWPLQQKLSHALDIIEQIKNSQT